MSFGAYGVTYSFSGKLILDSVSLEIEPGEVIALIGPNGAGKSSFLKIVAGILSPTSIGRSKITAQIRYRGEELSQQTSQSRAKVVTYVASELRADFPITAFEAVMMGRLCHHPGLFLSFSEMDEKVVKTAMQRSFCWDLREQDLDTLSGGEKQLVALARAIAQDTKVLLLDEALSKMDLHHQARIGLLLRELAAEGKGIVLVSHDVNLAAEWANAAMLLHRGVSIARGAIASVMTEENFRRVYPGAKIIVGKNPVTQAPQVFFGG